MERFCLFFTDILSVNTPHLNETNLFLTSICLNEAKSLILSLGLNSRNDVPWRTPPGQENFSPLGFKIVLKIICFSEEKKRFWVSCPFFPTTLDPGSRLAPFLPPIRRHRLMLDLRLKVFFATRLYFKTFKG